MLTFFLATPFTLGFYLPFVWLPTWLTKVHEPPVDGALTANTIALAMMISLTPLSGMLSDRIGRKWVYLAGTAGAAIATLLFVYLFIAPPQTPTHMALLADAANKPVLVVSLDLHHDRLTLDATRLPAAETGKSLELWILPPSGNPRSLGVIPAGEVSLPLDRKAASDLAQGALAVSLEPAGGSPTGLPTGPVLYSGPVLPAG